MSLLYSVCMCIIKCALFESMSYVDLINYSSSRRQFLWLHVTLNGKFHLGCGHKLNNSAYFLLLLPTTTTIIIYYFVWSDFILFFKILLVWLSFGWSTHLCSGLYGISKPLFNRDMSVPQGASRLLSGHVLTPDAKSEGRLCSPGAPLIGRGVSVGQNMAPKPISKCKGGDLSLWLCNHELPVRDEFSSSAG